MTEQGTFWLVEEDGQVELFRATHAERDSSPVAIRRFRELHPELPPVAAASSAASPPMAPPRVPVPMVFDCRLCGRSVTRQRVSVLIALQLCPPCSTARQQRERYRGDAEYRARRLASYATRYRRRRAGDGS